MCTRNNWTGQGSVWVPETTGNFLNLEIIWTIYNYMYKFYQVSAILEFPFLFWATSAWITSSHHMSARPKLEPEGEALGYAWISAYLMQSTHHDTPFPSRWNAYSPKRSYCQLLSFGQVADPLVTNLRWCTSQYPSACSHQCSALAWGWCDDSKCSALVLLSQVCTCTFVGQVGIVQSLQHPQ